MDAVGERRKKGRRKLIELYKKLAAKQRCSKKQSANCRQYSEKVRLAVITVQRREGDAYKPGWQERSLEHWREAARTHDYEIEVRRAILRELHQGLWGQ